MITYYDPLYGEQLAPFWIDKNTCNTSNTIVYVKTPSLIIGHDIPMFVYYGVLGNTSISLENPKDTFQFFVDLSNPSDVLNNLIIRTSGSASYQVTSSGLNINTGTDGELLIVNK
jgi:hypothetical protein